MLSTILCIVGMVLMYPVIRAGMDKYSVLFLHWVAYVRYGEYFFTEDTIQEFVSIRNFVMWKYQFHFLWGSSLFFLGVCFK